MYLKFFIILYIMLFSGDIFAMSGKTPKEHKIYKPGNGNTYVYDVIRWTGYDWARDKGCLTSNESKFNSIDKGCLTTNELELTYRDIINFHDSPKIESINYERRDLVYYSTNLSKDAKLDTRYWRRKEKKIILSENELNKPYIRLGTFTIAGPKPPDFKKVKKRILTIAYGAFAADAVIVERWEILPFDKDKYWPITEFEDDEYVLFHCVAVTFEDTVPLKQEELEKYIRRSMFKFLHGLTIDTAAEAHKK